MGNNAEFLFAPGVRICILGVCLWDAMTIPGLRPGPTLLSSSQESWKLKVARPAIAATGWTGQTAVKSKG